MHDAFVSACVALKEVPWAVCADHGRENVLVQSFMEYYRGVNSFRQTKSVQNQPIERFWREINTKVTCIYRAHWIQWEENGLNFGYDNVLFCLHYLFLPRLNEDLLQFHKQWNSHSIPTTVGNLSPNQLRQRLEDLYPPAVNLCVDEYRFAVFQPVP